MNTPRVENAFEVILLLFFLLPDWLTGNKTTEILSGEKAPVMVLTFVRGQLCNKTWGICFKPVQTDRN